MNEMLPTPKETLEEVGKATLDLEDARGYLERILRTNIADLSLHKLTDFDNAANSLAASYEKLNELYSRLEQGIADGEEY